jgi:TolB-like protein
MLCAIESASAGTREGTRPSRKRLALLHFSPVNSGDDAARVARNALELSLFKTGLFDILEKEHIGLINEERRRLTDQCRATDCALALGELLSADYVVTGTVEQGVSSIVIQVKIIDIRKKGIVITDTALAPDRSSIRRTVERMSRSISRKMERLDKKGPPVAITTAFNAVAPLAYLARKVGPGFGFTFSCYAEDMGARGLQLGGSARFIYYTGRSHEAHHAIMVPVSVLLGYRITLADFSINPMLGAGGSYSIVYYYRDRETSRYSGSDAFQPLLIIRP